MAISKLELQKMIKNGESVWVVDEPNNIEKVKPISIEKSANRDVLYLKYKYYISKYYDTDEFYYGDFEYFFKSKAEAEHYLHHANITRTETLPFLTWEEFSKINIKDIEFTDKKLNLYNLSGFGKIKLYRNIDTADETLLLELEATEQNFYKAYDECVRLFRGG